MLTTILFAIFYIIVGIALGWYVMELLINYIYNYCWVFPLLIIFEFVCVGFIPIWLMIITFK